MLKRKLKVCWLLPSLFIVLLSHDLIQAQSLKLDISLSDTTYYLCQSVWLDVELKNTGDDTLRVGGLGFPGDWQFNIVVTDSTGDTLSLRFLKEFDVGPGLLLKPRELTFWCYDLTKAYGNYELDGSPLFWQFVPSLAPGAYKASAWYLHEGVRLTTPELPFTVIKPDGKERHALSLFIEAYEDFRRRDYNSQKEKHRRLVAEFPTSVYAERALFRLFDYHELLRKYPNSRYTAKALRHATWDMDNEGKEEFLRATSEKYRSSRAARLAEAMLQSLRH